MDGHSLVVLGTSEIPPVQHETHDFVSSGASWWLRINTLGLSWDFPMLFEARSFRSPRMSAKKIRRQAAWWKAQYWGHRNWVHWIRSLGTFCSACGTLNLYRAFRAFIGHQSEVPMGIFVDWIPSMCDSLLQSFQLRQRCGFSLGQKRPALPHTDSASWCPF